MRVGSLRSATATSTKTSPQNITLLYHKPFAIISSCSRLTLSEMNWYERFQNEKREMKDSQLHAHVVVKTSNLVILRRCYAEDLKNIC